jgi:lycopene cyclase domain-containing protein
VTYGGFLLVFLVTPAAVLLVVALRGGIQCFHKTAAVLVCLLALLYTAPWDNIAAGRRLWTFDPAFVWGRPLWIGHLPLEEYLFYLAETVFVCVVVAALVRIRGLRPEPAATDTAWARTEP